MLAAAGVAFSVVPAAVDEDRLKADGRAAGRSSDAIVRALARAKAAAVAASQPDALVIGADQVLDLDGTLFSKAADRADARHQLEQLRGRSHTLISAVAVMHGGHLAWEAADTATLSVRAFTHDFLDAYLAWHGDETLTTVGCYRLEGLGVQLFERIDGDHFTILGLPLLPLLGYLRTQGVLIT
jgi:septum formation protein